MKAYQIKKDMLKIIPEEKLNQLKLSKGFL